MQTSSSIATLLALLVATMTASALAASVGGGSSKAVEWGYEALDGPSKWGTLSADFKMCDAGRSQSPVNFKGNDVRKDGFPDFKLASISKFNISNLGHTLQFTPVDAAAKDRGLTVNGTKFTLQQFHIHTPSEHRIDGRFFDGEFHLVHASPEGKIAVLGVFIDQTATDNPKWTEALAKIPEGDKTATLDALLDTQDIVALTKGGHFSYSGSLTTPPCTEGVTWFVASQPLTMSVSQLEKITNVIGYSSRPTMFNSGIAQRYGLKAPAPAAGAAAGGSYAGAPAMGGSTATKSAAPAKPTAANVQAAKDSKATEQSAMASSADPAARAGLAAVAAIVASLAAYMA
ncbi:hypothetical protein H9P43_009728 [Blastocladiella emersonii ATCC 22665]|nr:hypothetical protein H9P43_009728 [Blastocladiella emersonii ATCC 22665]